MNKSKRLKIGDIVVVTAGKDKGKRGRVLELTKDGERVLVEDVNMQVRHRRRNPQNQSEGGRTTKESTLHISNVMPWSDKDQKGVRVRAGEDKGKKVRVSAASGEVIIGSPAAPKKGEKKAQDKVKKEEDGES